MMRFLILSFLLSSLVGCATAKPDEVPDVQSAHMAPTNVDMNTEKLQRATTF